MNAKTHLISTLIVLAKKQNLEISFEKLISSVNEKDVIFTCHLNTVEEVSVKDVKKLEKPRVACVLNSYIDSLEEILYKDFFSEACDKTAEHIIKNLIENQKEFLAIDQNKHIFKNTTKQYICNQKLKKKKGENL